MIAGIDLGASFTKLVAVEDDVIAVKAFLPTDSTSVDELLKRLPEKPSKIYATGGASRQLKAFEAVDEIKAICLGGLYLAGKDKGVVASLGTGVCITAKDKHIKHVFGTGVGGGTILGLSDVLLKRGSFEELEAIARGGDARKVNLTVGDIANGGVGNLDADMTAANLVYLRAKDEDIAAGIFRMAGEVIGTIIAFACKTEKASDVVLTGMLAKSEVLLKVIREVLDHFRITAVVPKDCEYATALGACKEIKRR